VSVVKTVDCHDLLVRLRHSLKCVINVQHVALRQRLCLLSVSVYTDNM